MLYDVSTLYFETDTGDGFREPGFSKERRLELQITIEIDKPIQARALTRYHEAGEGMGLEFVDLPADQRNRIKQLGSK